MKYKEHTGLITSLALDVYFVIYASAGPPAQSCMCSRRHVTSVFSSRCAHTHTQNTLAKHILAIGTDDISNPSGRNRQVKTFLHTHSENIIGRRCVGTYRPARSLAAEAQRFYGNHVEAVGLSSWSGRHNTENITDNNVCLAQWNVVSAIRNRIRRLRQWCP